MGIPPFPLVYGLEDSDTLEETLGLDMLGEFLNKEKITKNLLYLDK
jgi:hypothetical protein